MFLLILGKRDLSVPAERTVKMLRFVALFLVSVILAGCITPDGRFMPIRQTVKSPSVSDRISTEELRNCNDAACFVKLAEQENNKIWFGKEKEIGYTHMAVANIHLDREAEAIKLISKVDDKKIRKSFFSSFGSINEGKIIRFLIESQKWDNVEIPLPAAFLGQHPNFDKLYAFFLMVDERYDEALAIAERLDNAKDKDAVYYRLTKLFLARKQYDKAIATAQKFTSRNKKGLRAQSIALIISKMYLNGEEEQAKALSEAFSSSFERDVALTGLAFAQTQQINLPEALENVSKVQDAKVKSIGYRGVMLHLAEQGDITALLRMLDSSEAPKIRDKDYRRFVRLLSKGGYIFEAEQFIEKMPSEKLTIDALAMLGGETGDRSYFRQAEVLTEKLKETDYKAANSRSFPIALNLVKAGYPSEAIDALHNYNTAFIRTIARVVIFSDIFRNKKAAQDYNRVLDFAEKDMSLSAYGEYRQILKIAAGFFYVDRADSKAINRYLDMVERAPNKWDREYLQMQVIPHLLFLGETTRAYDLVSKMDHTIYRVQALTRIANFHRIKKHLNKV